jgi:hypothetical protein
MGASADGSPRLAGLQSRLQQAHTFFGKAIQEWADISSDPDNVRGRLSVLAKVLQQHLQIVSINLSISDDDQLIFETLNNRGTPLLAADLIKNFVFQRCEDMGADVDAWTDRYWQDFDEDWSCLRAATLPRGSLISTSSSTPSATFNELPCGGIECRQNIIDEIQRASAKPRLRSRIIVLKAADDSSQAISTPPIDP